MTKPNTQKPHEMIVPRMANHFDVSRNRPVMEQITEAGPVVRIRHFAKVQIPDAQLGCNHSIVNPVTHGMIDITRPVRPNQRFPFMAHLSIKKAGKTMDGRKI